MFWTKMAKFFLWFFAVIFLIAAIGIGIWVGGEGGGFGGFLAFLGSLAVLYLVLCAFGMMVELSYHVNDIRRTIKNMDINGFAPDEALADSIFDGKGKSYSSGWTCSFCGTSNSDRAAKCEDCGKKRPGAAVSKGYSLGEVARQVEEEKKEQMRNISYPTVNNSQSQQQNNYYPEQQSAGSGYEQNNYYPEQQYDNTQYEQYNYNTQTEQQAPKVWYCRYCGFANKKSNVSGYCASCGKPA